MDILIFKTNLSDLNHVNAIEPYLDIHPHIVDWNVDLHDRDNILRVVSENILPSAIESILTEAGYCCEELQ